MRYEQHWLPMIIITKINQITPTWMVWRDTSNPNFCPLLRYSPSDLLHGRAGPAGLQVTKMLPVKRCGNRRFQLPKVRRYFRALLWCRIRTQYVQYTTSDIL